MDFIFPEVHGEGAIQTFLLPRPMLYCKAASILRHVAKQPFMSPPYNSSEVATLTVHSTKSALISAAKQLDLPTHWIAEQGHHRGKRTQGDRYSRDDTVYQLLLQKTVVCKTKRGWKPITLQARGGQHPLPQKHFIIPTGDLKWPAFLEVALNSSLYNLSEDTTEQPHDLIRRLYYLYRMALLHLRRQFLRFLLQTQILSRNLHHLPHQKMNSKKTSQDLSF